MSTETKKSNVTPAMILKMIIGSLIGLWIFVIPYGYTGIGNPKGRPIPFLSWMKGAISAKTGNFLPWFGFALTVLAFVGAVYGIATKNKEHGRFFKSCFVVSPFNLCIRALALVIAIICMFFKNSTNEFIAKLTCMDTGGLIMWDLMPSLILFFWLGTVLLPLLTEYGLMDLIGGILKPVFRPLFRIPGGSAPLAFSGLIGSGTVGIVTTEAEYAKGRLTKREAVIITTIFCTIAYSAMMAYCTAFAGLESEYFMMAFVGILLVVVIAGVVMSRIPPIGTMPNEYYEGVANPYAEGQNVLESACTKAKAAPGPIKMIVDGSKSSFRLWMLVFPTIITLATIVLFLAMFTPVFNWLATPFVPLLNAMGVPEASSVAPALFTGFADLLLPFISAATITSQLAKFILCIVGVTQLICMTESGMLLMNSKLKIKFHQLLFIFLEKTVIAFAVGLLLGKAIGLA